MSDELKECPFCGGEAKTMPGYDVVCRGCHSLAFDVATWNRRAAPSPASTRTRGFLTRGGVLHLYEDEREFAEAIKEPYIVAGWADEVVVHARPEEGGPDA